MIDYDILIIYIDYDILIITVADMLLTPKQFSFKQLYTVGSISVFFVF